MTQTFVAKSGNVAIMEVKGRRGNAKVVDIGWAKRPTKKDIRECDAYWRKQPHCIGTTNVLIENPQERKGVIDEILYGGRRN